MYEFDRDRLEKVHALRAEGIPAWPSGFTPTHTSAQIRALVEGVEDDALDALGAFTFAGRLLLKREMGKAGFGGLLDRAGRLQIYVKRDDVGEEGLALFKKLDLGDIVGVTGTLMRTRTGELTIKVAELRLLSKCIQSLPDKFHGVSDPELRRRQRYLDLFVNDETRVTFERRSKIVSYVRRFFDERAYLEVETPMMHPIPGGATARPFVTHHNALDADFYLRVAPELYLKRLVVGGFERVYEVGRTFRNEGFDATHNPEFTMLEFYQAYATWKDLVTLTEELMHGLVVQVTGGETFTYQGQEVSFRRPFRVAGMDELISEKTGLTIAQVHDAAHMRVFTGMDKTLGKLWEHCFDLHVEKSLVDPTFVTRFPIEISPLARRSETSRTSPSASSSSAPAASSATASPS